MASPVDTSVKHFTFEMLGAPVLSGTPGTAIGLLDACLITGFGLQAATSLTVAGGVATLTFASAHAAAVDSVILVEGVTGALVALNGEQRVTALGTNQVKFATEAPDGSAAGSITAKMAPAGWAKPFSGTNLAVYRSPNVEGTRMFLRIDDTGTTAFRLRGYETMTAVSAGTGLFPTNAQISGGGWCNKSSQASGTPVKWTVVANSRGAYLSIAGYSADHPSTETGRTVYVGDVQAFRTGGDPYAFSIGCADNGGEATPYGTCDVFYSALDQYSPRSHTGLGGAVAQVSIPESGSLNGPSGMDSVFGNFPSDVDGGLRLSRRLLGAPGAAPRGAFPGLYTVPQLGVGQFYRPRTFQAGAGVLAGRKLIAVGGYANGYSGYPSTQLGICFIDITGPWAL